MKNIKFLNWVLIVFMGLSILGIILNLYLIWEYPDVRYAYKNHGYVGYINSLISLLFVYGLYQIQQSLSESLTHNYFSFKSAVYLKRGGYTLLAYTIISTTISLFSIQFLERNVLFRDFSNDAVLYIVSIGLLAVADIIKSGTRIKQENDLTI